MTLFLNYSKRKTKFKYHCLIKVWFVILISQNAQMLSSRTVVTEIADIVEICHFVTTKTEHAQADVNPDINNTIANNVSQNILISF